MVDPKRTLKWGFTAAAVLGLVLLAAVFLRYRGQQDRYVVPLPDVATQALMRLVGVHQTATKDGKTQWELDAASAELEADSGRMILHAPVVLFHTESDGTVHLTAERGELDTRTNDMAVSGNVRMWDGRYTLETQKLVYRHEERTLLSEVPVRIDGGQFGLRADRMTYDLNTNKAQFDGTVEGALHEALAIR